MKLSGAWLCEWVDHGLDADELSRRLTLLGLEVDALERVGEPLEQVVVGLALETRRHPDADRLTLCRVDVGADTPLDIVCGAPNVRAGGRYPVALPGARLPGGLLIKASKIRGQASAGMLCSGRELGLEGQPDGLLDLDADAIPGQPVTPLLALGDCIVDINITPNRADCFSVAGIAREVAAHTGRPLTPPACEPVAATLADRVEAAIAPGGDCTRFVTRVVRGIRTDAATPLWMRERLRRSGIRAIHPVVDITNYVMLELGQPMHAYDLGRLRGAPVARRARSGESVELLDGQVVTLDEQVLAIADDEGPVGLAGIMGGQRTAVGADTSAILFESAWFSRETIAGRARRFGLVTDASIRFERGVDPALQVRAIERATALLLEIAGGQAGPVADRADPAHLQNRQAVRLRRERLSRLLGATFPDERVVTALRGLGMVVAAAADGWTVTPPTARFDIEREEDLVEEVARAIGYGEIPSSPGRGVNRPVAVSEYADPVAGVSATLVARGYQEAITYSFVDPGLARRFGGAVAAHLTLSNPIAADLAAMRPSLWPGLVQAAAANLARQQDRVRLYEVGTRFLETPEGGHHEEAAIAFVAAGTRLPQQWGSPVEPVDFFDAKSDVQALLELAGLGADARFEPAAHPALHPGRSARIVDRSGEVIGWLGEMHPALARELELPRVLLFEARLASLTARARPAYAPISKFPAIRRDIAVVVPRDLAVSALLDCVRASAPATLRRVFVFDIYTGKHMADAEKSVAIGLILQDTSRTLTVEDADDILGKVTGALRRDLKARIRE